MWSFPFSWWNLVVLVLVSMVVVGPPTKPNPPFRLDEPSPAPVYEPTSHPSPVPEAVRAEDEKEEFPYGPGGYQDWVYGY